MGSTPDGTFDTCKECGKDIKYDKPDGFWDNLVIDEMGKKMWTPFNCKTDKPHEPINHISDEKGYYYPRAGKV